VCPGVTHKITTPMMSEDVLAKIRKEHHITGDQVIVPLFGGKQVSQAWARFFSGKGAFFGFGAKQEFPPPTSCCKSSGSRGKTGTNRHSVVQ